MWGTSPSASASTKPLPPTCPCCCCWERPAATHPMLCPTHQGTLRAVSPSADPTAVPSATPGPHTARPPRPGAAVWQRTSGGHLSAAGGPARGARGVLCPQPRAAAATITCFSVPTATSRRSLRKSVIHAWVRLKRGAAPRPQLCACRGGGSPIRGRSPTHGRPTEPSPEPRIGAPRALPAGALSTPPPPTRDPAARVVAQTPPPALHPDVADPRRPQPTHPPAGRPPPPPHSPRTARAPRVEAPSFGRAPPLRSSSSSSRSSRPRGGRVGARRRWRCGRSAPLCSRRSAVRAAGADGGGAGGAQRGGGGAPLPQPGGGHRHDPLLLQKVAAAREENFPGEAGNAAGHLEPRLREDRGSR